jgi:hypothetical protein
MLDLSVSKFCSPSSWNPTPVVVRNFCTMYTSIFEVTSKIGFDLSLSPFRNGLSCCPRYPNVVYWTEKVVYIDYVTRVYTILFVWYLITS